MTRFRQQVRLLAGKHGILTCLAPEHLQRWLPPLPGFARYVPHLIQRTIQRTRGHPKQLGIPRRGWDRDLSGFSVAALYSSPTQTQPKNFTTIGIQSRKEQYDRYWHYTMAAQMPLIDGLDRAMNQASLLAGILPVEANTRPF